MDLDVTNWKLMLGITVVLVSIVMIYAASKGYYDKGGGYDASKN